METLFGKIDRLKIYNVSIEPKRDGNLVCARYLLIFQNVSIEPKRDGNLIYQRVVYLE